jgi:hypothetical protein
MHDSKNEGLVVLQEIDDTATSEDQFSKVRAIEFWNHSTDLGSLEQGIGRFNNAINERDRMEDGVAGDKVFDVLRIVPGGQRSADLRHRAILSFSSSCVRTRLSATSWRPFSTCCLKNNSSMIAPVLTSSGSFLIISNATALAFAIRASSPTGSAG